MENIIGAGPRIRKWRKATPMKGYELAKKLKISQGSLSDIENGKSNPSAATIVSFIKNTDINYHWMLTGKLDYELRSSGAPHDLEFDGPSPAPVVVINKSCNEVIVRYEE